MGIRHSAIAKLLEDVIATESLTDQIAQFLLLCTSGQKPKQLLSELWYLIRLAIRDSDYM
jgi:hypothetical protein